MTPTDNLVEAIAEAVVRRLRDLPTSNEVQPRLLTVEQAAQYLGRSANGIRHLINEGKLRTVKLDQRVFLDIHDLDETIENSK
jgi:excisionase family DNA binding protein